MKSVIGRETSIGQRGDERVNIASRLADSAATYPNKPAVILAARGGRAARVVTFAELDREATAYAAGLRRIGLQAGMRVIVMVKPGPEFFALTFALFRVGAIPVLIDPGMGRKNLAQCLAGVRARAFIGIPLAHVFRLMHATAFRDLRVKVTVGRRLFWAGVTLADIRDADCQSFIPADTRATDPAAILFTSGSTGPAKGVIYEHGMFAAQVDYLARHYQYAPEETDLATFPLFALFDAALGMTAVIPDMDASRPGTADPRKILDAIETHECTHMFGSPALLTNLARHCVANNVRISGLRRIITCGAPAPARLLRSLTECAPNASIHTPYGATECLPITDISADEILRDTAKKTANGGGVCVGRPLPGMAVRVIDISDEPIRDESAMPLARPGAIGEIVAHGPTTTREYFDAPVATQRAKIPASDGGVWHRMGDVGWIDDNGRVWFCGRKAHRVQTADGVMFSVPCEQVFLSHPGVARVALVGVGPIGAQRPVLCVEVAKSASGDRGALTRELLAIAAKFEHTRVIRDVLYHPSFPVDVRHNAKIRREDLAIWAAGKLRA
ncbi:MAG: AMP-binding protein [Phycisphaerales bacterium]|nr:AMP-binding protein [Phycisphaerales bacterium]